MKLLCIIASLLLFTPSVFAKGGACKADREKLCKGIEKGEGRIGHCLFTNWGSVSPTCKAKRNEGFERWNKRQMACGPDIKTLCAANAGDRKAVRQCLRTNKTKLSTGCQAFMQERKESHKEKLAACQSDIDSHCQGITKGGGATWKCLVANQAKLTDGCKDQWPSLGRRAQNMQRKEMRMKRKAAKADGMHKGGKHKGMKHKGGMKPATGHEGHNH